MYFQPPHYNKGGSFFVCTFYFYTASEISTCLYTKNRNISLIYRISYLNAVIWLPPPPASLAAEPIRAHSLIFILCVTTVTVFDSQPSRLTVKKARSKSSSQVFNYSNSKKIFIRDDSRNSNETHWWAGKHPNAVQW